MLTHTYTIVILTHIYSIILEHTYTIVVLTHICHSNVTHIYYDNINALISHNDISTYTTITHMYAMILTYIL